MLAHFQKMAIALLLTSALAFFCAFWTFSSFVAFLGSFSLLFSYAGLLAVQFALMAKVNRQDSLQTASATTMAKAWLVEAASAALVFAWQQPFRSNAIPDQTGAATGHRNQRGVVFVHGFICNRGLWNSWLKELQIQQIAFVAVSLEPVFGSIDSFIPEVEKAIKQVRQVTGLAPLLVCHSMGGLVARAWLRTTDDGASKVQHIVTIGSPHQGTKLGHIAPRIPAIVNGEQMRFGSAWLLELAQTHVSEPAGLFTCFYSDCDNIVMPASSAKLPGADNRLVHGVAHLAMVLDKDVMDQTLAMLRSE